MRIALLHGFLGDPAIWDATIDAWQREDDELVTVALPGHGGGPVRDTWDDNVAAVALAIGEVDVAIGYSLGGRVALGLLAAGRVPRAILVSANPGLPDEERASRRMADADWIRVLRERGIIPFLDVWEAQPLFVTRMRAPLSAREARRARRLQLDPGELARSLETMGVAEMPDYRRVVDDRVGLVVGEDDAKFLAIARALPAKLETISECGHDPTLEQPAALAAALSRLLA